MPIFTATPGQEVAQAKPTLVAGPITDYLESNEKQLDQAVLDWMTEAFIRKVIKQIMSARDTRKGHDSCSMYSGSCPRKAWHQYNGTPGEPLQARAMLKFLMGDTVELDVVGVARLAGVRLYDNNINIYVTGLDGVKVPVHPDGRVMADQAYNFECKSMDTNSFDACKAKGGPDDRWGYLTQASVEIAAWRENGYPNMSHTCFLTVSTGSRQGSVEEYIIPYDQALVDAWHARRMLSRGKDLPPVPFEAEMEAEYVKGKLLDAKYLEHGEAEPCLDKNGRTHGWKVKTGRKILPTYCGYCSYKASCWPNAEMTVDGGKPVWVCKE